MALVFVRATTSGATFNPVIQLVSGATGSARWVCEETSEELTGLSPTFNWGTAATRHVRLYVEVTPGGTDVLGEVVTWNTGFYDYNDSGRYNIGASFNKAPEAITAIEGVNLMTGLVRFLSANTNLASHLDFTGCAALEYIECYYADVTGVTLTGCTSLIRLCLENCSCSTLDLNPVVSTLRDCRAAIQNTASLTFTTLTAPLAVDYHFCVRDQTVLNIPPVSQFPAVEEFWIWNTGQSGHLVTGPAVTSLQAYSNNYTTADISASTHMETCMLYGNDLVSTSVDGILIDLRDFGETPPPARSVNLTGNPGNPTANGVAAANELIADGWSVGIESESSVGVHIDDFDRPNGVPGNGWHGLLGGQGNFASGTIASNHLQRLDNAAYQLYGNPGGGDLPADYTVYAVVPHATTTTYFGIFGRWAGGNGVRLLFTDNRTTITVGEAFDWGQNNITLTTDNAIPASWAVNQPHTIAMRMVGTLIEIYLDGVLVRHGTLALNSTATGTEYGICGEGANRLWDEIGTFHNVDIGGGIDISTDVIGSIVALVNISANASIDVTSSGTLNAIGSMSGVVSSSSIDVAGFMPVVSDVSTAIDIGLDIQSLFVSATGSLTGNVAEISFDTIANINGQQEIASNLSVGIDVEGSFESPILESDLASSNLIETNLVGSINGIGNLSALFALGMELEASSSNDTMMSVIQIGLAIGDVEARGDGEIVGELPIGLNQTNLSIGIEAGPIFCNFSISVDAEGSIFTDEDFASETSIEMSLSGTLQDTGLEAIILTSLSNAVPPAVVPFATVRVWNSAGFELNLGAVTDATGRVVFEVPAGSYRMVVEKPGWGFYPINADITNAVTQISFNGIQLQTNWLHWEDLESIVDNSVIDRLFNDTNSAGRKWKLVELVVQQAESLAESQLLRNWTKDQVELLAANDPAMRAQAAWLALEAASERKQEFIAADGKGRYWAQYERAMAFFSELGKSKSHSRGEANAGHGANAGGAVRPVRSGQPRFTFADEPDGTGHGGF